MFALCIFRYCRKMLALEKKLIVILGLAEFANDVWHQGWGCWLSAVWAVTVQNRIGYVDCEGFKPQKHFCVPLHLYYIQMQRSIFHGQSESWPCLQNIMGAIPRKENTAVTIHGPKVEFTQRSNSMRVLNMWTKITSVYVQVTKTSICCSNYDESKGGIHMALL